MGAPASHPFAKNAKEWGTHSWLREDCEPHS